MLLSEDKYSRIFQAPDNDSIKLVWLETTSNMTDDDFKSVSERFAIQASEIKVNGLVVDVRQFRHKMTSDISPWRMEILIAKYHDSGVSKFAFVHGENFSPPPNNGDPRDGENFVTMHFKTENEALEWFTT